MAWTQRTTTDATWTDDVISPPGSPPEGVAYDSVLFYDGTHSYNQADQIFAPVWNSGEGAPAVWT